MDARHFDRLARALNQHGTRRGLLGLLATLPVLGGLIGFLDLDETDAKGRRKRRKKRHKKRTGDRKQNRKGKHKGKHKKKRCVPESAAQTCAGRCGSVTNNCQQAVDCGPCACDPPCGVCFVCDEATRTCVPDPGQRGASCGNGQVCQADGACACSGGSCGACRTCQADGACTGCTGCCDGAQCVAQCPACQVCESGSCAGCPDCCDTAGVCQPGETDGACGSSGECAICTGQDECQGQTCECVPACGGKVCGPDGCGDVCGPGCAACETCLGNGACSAPCGGSGCCTGTACVDGESDTACGRNGEMCLPCSGIGATCGGGATPGVCGCTPLTACPAGLDCGTIEDGCGGMVDCGNCSGFETCGGGTPPQANVCGCTPITTCPGGLDCGTIDDGCGATVNCGSCGGATTVCLNNVCVACSASVPCPAGQCCAGNGSCGSCLVFVTSTERDGNLGGLEGADAICQAHATAAGLPGASTYMAWLSGETISPSTRFLTKASEPYRLVTGETVADNWTALTTTLPLQHAIDVTETGITNVIAPVWSHTQPDGTAITGEEEDGHCQGWTTGSVSVHADYGGSSATSSRWTDEMQTFCDSTGALYCFQQS